MNGWLIALIIMGALVLVTMVLFVIGACKISSLCSRIEEEMEEMNEDHRS